MRIRRRRRMSLTISKITHKFCEVLPDFQLCTRTFASSFKNIANILKMKIHHFDGEKSKKTKNLNERNCEICLENNFWLRLGFYQIRLNQLKTLSSVVWRRHTAAIAQYKNKKTSIIKCKAPNADRESERDGDDVLVRKIYTCHNRVAVAFTSSTQTRISSVYTRLTAVCSVLSLA